MSSIFGGKKSQSTSSSTNQAYPFLQQQFGDVTGSAASGSNALSALLGGDMSGLNTFKKNMGFNAMAETGSRGITGNAAAGGLLRSGGTGKALMNYGTELNNQFANTYMDRLLGQAGLGIQAGQLLGAAGQTQKSQSSASEKDGGFGKFLGNVAGAVAMSERKYKFNIEQVTTLSDGLPIYNFRYYDDPTTLHTGTMVEDAEVFRPEALGPVIDGRRTVDYSKVWSQL